MKQHLLGCIIMMVALIMILTAVSGLAESTAQLPDLKAFYVYYESSTLYENQSLDPILSF